MADQEMPMMTFDHAGLSVGDLERSHRFYADVLGFHITEDTFSLPQFEIRGRVLRNDAGVRIELFERQGARPGRPGHPADSALVHGWFQVALRVADARATFDHVVAAGATPVMAPRVAPDGRAIFAFIADPDGTLIEFLQRPDDAG